MLLNKTLATILLSLSVLSVSYGQRSINIHDHLLIRDSNRYLFGVMSDDYEGSPYLNDEFVLGYVYQGSLKFEGVPMRYNIYADVMEFQDKGHTFLLEPDPRITKIEIGHQVFVVREFKHLTKVQNGFLEVLKEGKASLMAKKLVNFREKMELRDIPAKFARLDDAYYYKIDDQPVLKTSSLKALIESFPDKHGELTQFAKAAKISTKNGADLVKLFEYYNSLFSAH